MDCKPAELALKTFMNQKGLTLIEILLMVALIGLVAGALGQLSAVSIKTSDAARLRTTTNELARQATELARSQRDSNPAAFFALDGYYSVDAGNSFVLQTSACGTHPCAVYQVPGTAYQNFYREVRIQKNIPSANKSTVTVKVYYSLRGVYDNVVIQTILTNWR